MAHSFKRGFTLLEMSMVMLVIGLILGGILIGREMIRNSELNAILAEQRAFQIAISNFEQKYSGLPGDMPNATRYWTDEVSGNNNGRIDWAESDYAWRQLSKAGFIVGSFTGTGDTATSLTDSPNSKISNAVWSFLETTQMSYATGWYDNADYFEKTFLVIGEAVTGGAILTPGEAYSLDMKVDDGAPYRGKVVGPPNAASSCTTGTSGSLSYNTTVDSKLCRLSFLLLQQ